MNAAKFDQFVDKLIDLGITSGKHILVALLVYVAGKFLLNLVMRVVMGMLQRRNVDVSVQSFLHSFLNIVLTILLVVSEIGRAHV